jgi:hypothetical protein
MSHETCPMCDTPMRLCKCLEYFDGHTYIGPTDCAFCGEPFDDAEDQGPCVADASKALDAYRVLVRVGLRDCREHDKCPTPEQMHSGGWAVCWTLPGEKVGRIYPECRTPELAVIAAAAEFVKVDPTLSEGLK